MCTDGVRRRVRLSKGARKANADGHDPDTVRRTLGHNGPLHAPGGQCSAKENRTEIKERIRERLRTRYRLYYYHTAALFQTRMSKQSSTLGEWKGSGDSDRGVSPVVGVVLMIVLAVSLTVVVGGFTSDLVDQATVTSAPQASINVYNQEGGSAIIVAHDGGEALEEETFDVVVREANGERLGVDYNESKDLAPGDTLTVSRSSGDFTADAEYEVLVIDDESGKIVDRGAITYRG